MPAETAPFADLELADRRTVIAAVSGGSDSLGLLVLLSEHLSVHGLATRIVAVTVDHGLRKESAREAAEVGRLCQRFGIAHVTKHWQGAKPRTGLAAAARKARHDLLAEAAREHGTDIVMTGHTLDDQAETVLMRSRRGSASPGRGLAGMARDTLFDGSVWLVRPLLAVRRHELREILLRRGVAWIDDPTNEDRSFERVRIRSVLSAVEGECELRRLIALSEGVAIRRQALGEEASTLIDAHGRRATPGLYRLDAAFSHAAGRDAALYAFRLVLATVGGKADLPDRERTEQLLDRIGEDRFRATLSRTALDCRRGRVWMRRELRGLPSFAPASEPVIWDGRFRVTGASDGPELRVKALGAVGAVGPAGKGADAPQGLVQAALSAQPGLWRGGEILGGFDAPTGLRDGVRVVPVVAPFARYMSGLDTAVARSLLRLVGAGEPPISPFRKHIGP